MLVPSKLIVLQYVFGWLCAAARIDSVCFAVTREGLRWRASPYVFGESTDTLTVKRPDLQRWGGGDFLRAGERAVY